MLGPSGVEPGCIGKVDAALVGHSNRHGARAVHAGLGLTLALPTGCDIATDSSPEASLAFG